MNTESGPEVVLAGGGPISRQIHDQIRDLILAGRLRPGEELPTVRTVAVELAINPNTVARAYEELERDGYVRAGEGSGVYATLPPVQWDPRATVALEDLCRSFLAEADRRGHPAEDVLSTVQTLVRRRNPS